MGMLPIVVRAAPTGLNQIPTTDLVPFNQLSLQLQNNNTEISGSDSVFHQPQLVPQSEFGLPWQLEAGLDVSPSDPPGDYRPIVNVKWSPIEEAPYLPAAGAGVTQLGPDITANYFLVLSKTIDSDAIEDRLLRAAQRHFRLRGMRGHTGLLRTSNAWRALVGIDFELNDRAVLYSDWMSGGSNAFSFGGVFVINRQDSIQAALFHGNDESRVVSGALLAISHTFDFAHPFEW
jgi:hypothetical protein